MADGNILSNFGIDLLEEEIDDVIFQTNEFLTDATFTGAQGPFWWLAHFCLFQLLQITYYQYFVINLSCEKNLKRDKNGTKPMENKIKNAMCRISVPRISLCTAKVQFCPVKTKQRATNMLSDSAFYTFGLYAADTSSAESCHLRFAMKHLLISVSSPLYTAAFQTLYNALLECAANLPISECLNECSISTLTEKATCINSRTERQSLNCTVKEKH